jgi:hypothetical protein
MPHPVRNLLFASALALLATAPAAAAGNVNNAPPPAPYKKVSELVKLPDFAERDQHRPTPCRPRRFGGDQCRISAGQTMDRAPNRLSYVKRPIDRR